MSVSHHPESQTKKNLQSRIEIEGILRRDFSRSRNTRREEGRKGRRRTYRVARAASAARASARTRPPQGWARRPSPPSISAWRGWRTRPGGPCPASWRRRRPPRACTGPLPRRPAPTPRSASRSAAAAAGSRLARTSAASPASSSRLPSPPLPSPRKAQPPEPLAQAESSPVPALSPASAPGPARPPWSPSWAPDYNATATSLFGPWPSEAAALPVHRHGRDHETQELGIVHTHSPELSTNNSWKGERPVRFSGDLRARPPAVFRRGILGHRSDEGRKETRRNENTTSTKLKPSIGFNLSKGRKCFFKKISRKWTDRHITLKKFASLFDLVIGAKLVGDF
jgi:hypothetical protein